MPKRYPPEFRRRVLDLLKAGRSVADLVRDLQISDQTIYTWRRQELIAWLDHPDSPHRWPLLPASPA